MSEIYQVNTTTKNHLFNDEKIVAIQNKKGGIFNKIVKMVRRDYRIKEEVRPKIIEAGLFKLGNIECSFCKYRIQDLVDEVL